MKEILVLHGPNLNFLGIREPEIYGNQTLQDLEELLNRAASERHLSLTFFQTNHEGAMIDWIHAARGTAGGIVINPGAWTHTSVAILDALNAFEAPVIEVHISNIHKRESFRHHSFVSLRAEGVIAGCGIEGYALALRRMATLTGAAA